ncbi:sigma factor-like helix-turn-helix DNA-binding protein [Campylobacter jejuni]|uniref:sigma factor-like helix-turn-helix DNA-binding protein n=1 Tax=Campylobacter jejuni TaxID=197 RepID=UPI0013774D19|nr:sigma factor-like helix-turn-helix DNA-binding protein [Campylobacter jejuni]NBE34252.1 RNA polymerase subunit sigma-70 [Campylobacter jejuni]NBE86436.1 RNA polymerase subunit sigma-70 [Campylobacter jejuni]
MSFEEIAKELGISKTRVYQIYEYAIKKLRSPRNKDKWLAIFETLDLIEQEKTKRNNLIQGVEHDNND